MRSWNSLCMRSSLNYLAGVLVTLVRLVRRALLL